MRNQSQFETNTKAACKCGKIVPTGHDCFHFKPITKCSCSKLKHRPQLVSLVVQLSRPTRQIVFDYGLRIGPDLGYLGLVIDLNLENELHMYLQVTIASQGKGYSRTGFLKKN